MKFIHQPKSISWPFFGKIHEFVCRFIYGPACECLWARARAHPKIYGMWIEILGTGPINGWLNEAIEN